MADAEISTEVVVVAHPRAAAIENPPLYEKVLITFLPAEIHQTYARISR
jgi:hypothetical protein